MPSIQLIVETRSLEQDQLTLCNEHLQAEMYGQRDIQCELLGCTAVSMMRFLIPSFKKYFFSFYFLHFFLLDFVLLGVYVQGQRADGKGWGIKIQDVKNT